MIVLCKPEESDYWYEKLWNYTVELFVSMEIPVRQLICCSGGMQTGDIARKVVKAVAAGASCAV